MPLPVMGYSGEKAIEFKIKYINAFNEMEAQIREMQKSRLTRDEYALVFQLVNFFKYLENCKMIEKTHRDTFIAQKKNTGKPFQVAQTKLKEEYSKPYYWGAFVLIGD